jgi:hypothetical protein
VPQTERLPHGVDPRFRDEPDQKLATVADPSFRDYLFAFGLFAIRRLVAPMLAGWIDRFSGNGYQFVEVIALHATFLETDLQLSLHRALVEKCESRRFDVKLFETMAVVMMGASPARSPFIGRFVAAASKCWRPAVVFGVRGSARIEPVVHASRDEMQITKVRGKRLAFVQATEGGRTLCRDGCEFGQSRWVEWPLELALDRRGGPI